MLWHSQQIISFNVASMPESFNKAKLESLWLKCLYQVTHRRAILINTSPPTFSISEENKYIIRHEKICTHLHYAICRKYDSETAEN
jgi:hypothetical protein